MICFFTTLLLQGVNYFYDIDFHDLFLLHQNTFIIRHPKARKSQVFFSLEYGFTLSPTVNKETKKDKTKRSCPDVNFLSLTKVDKESFFTLGISSVYFRADL